MPQGWSQLPDRPYEPDPDARLVESVQAMAGIEWVYLFDIAARRLDVFEYRGADRPRLSARAPSEALAARLRAATDTSGTTVAAGLGSPEPTPSRDVMWLVGPALAAPPVGGQVEPPAQAPEGLATVLHRRR